LEATSSSAARVVFIAFSLAALLGVSGLSGCASAGKGPTTPAAEVPAAAPSGAVPTETYGPPAPPSPDHPEDVYGPSRISVRPIVLVLGPGLARGFAYVGALRALHEAKIPIAAVLGTEMGALIGALYSMEGKINQFEWALLKFKDDVFETPKGMLPAVFQKSSNSKKLETELSHIFNKKDLNESKVPLRIAIQMKDGNTATVLERGQAVEAVRAALGDPSIFEDTSFNGAAALSAARTRPLLIAEAKAMNLGPVIVIDALEERDEKKYVSASELKDADLVIHPDLRGIGANDFQKRTEAAFRGKKAVNAQLAEIKHLVGIP
jgi:NTE family protein